MGEPPPAPGSATKARLQIHLSVFAWGFTAILGRLIRLSAIPLVFWRMLVVLAVLVFVPSVRRGLRAIPGRLLVAYAGIGLLVTAHWIAFYAAIKLANASIAATCIALAPVFVALVEPSIAGRRFDPRELALGAAVVPGVALVVGGVRAPMRPGLAVGVLAAILVALFGALNKRLIRRAEPLTIVFVELGAGVAALAALAALPLDDQPLLPLPDARDALLLAVLAIGCTLLPFSLSLVALRHLTAYEAQLTVNLEPVYSIALAIVLLGEHHELGPSFYAGVALVLGVVLVHPATLRRRRDRAVADERPG